MSVDETKPCRCARRMLVLRSIVSLVLRKQSQRYSVYGLPIEDMYKLADVKAI